MTPCTLPPTVQSLCSGQIGSQRRGVRAATPCLRREDAHERWRFRRRCGPHGWWRLERVLQLPPRTGAVVPRARQIA
ncbi:hypothetical protein IAE22_31160 [Bacillus sp. S34]|nr:hypothetical protein [Bacillus sp. S34]